jgi:hypothetical protein
MEGLTGVTAIDTNVGAVTVMTDAGDVTPLSVAVMLLVPTATAVASPLVEIVATDVVAEAHVTVAVIFCVLVSL